MTKAEKDHTTTQLEDQIAALRADIARIVETLGNLGQNGAETLRASLTEKAETLRSTGEARLADVSQSAETALGEATDYARRKPLQTLAMAGGVGLLLGLLLGRR
jgi:ElaB/YqjD/DUF883 family membrane-anchored ribosome-binding protein